MGERRGIKLHDEIVEVLIERRKAKDLSHETLASLAGLHRTTISHIENRRRNPTLMVCLRLADALECSLADVIKQAEKRV